jgi:2-oxoglutarate ferredoxin oxidoreductase subunit gamma
MNSSLIPEDPERRDIHVFKIPATELADALRSEVGFETMKDTKITANSVMFGAYLAVSGETLESLTTVKQVFTHFLIDRKAQYIPLNLKAVDKGFKFAEGLLIAPSQS